MNKKMLGFLCSAAGLAVAIAPFPAPAFAQDAEEAAAPQEVPSTDEAAPDDEVAPEGEITVTASRVNREGYTAPTPTIVVGEEQLEQRGTTNIGQFLNEIPSFRATSQPTTNGMNQRSNGSYYVDLRGLGTSRTLVLVNGRRFVPEMSAGVPGYNVNLNQIPALMVDRLEIVTGGASAQWGSDAVAGVVNVLLKKDFEGFQAEVQGGTTTHGDGESIRAGAVLGRNFADGRGNLTVAADFEKFNGIGDLNNRDWGREHYFLIPNPCPNAVPVSAACPAGGNGQAANLILPDVQFSTASFGGLITNTTLRGTTFGPGGVPGQLTYGNYVGGTYMAGGSQPGAYYPDTQQIAAGYTRFQSYFRGSYALSDAVTLFGEASYSYSQGGGSGAPNVRSLTIRRENAFLPAEVRNRMVADNIATFSLGRFSRELVSRGRLTNHTSRLVAGADGEFGGSWKWSVAGGYGVNKYAQRVRGAAIIDRYLFAVDSTLVGGVPTCRATIVGGAAYNPAAAGCVPVNVFGPGSITGPALDYVTGEPAADIRYTQAFGDASLSGEPFETWAGPVSIALGASIRHETENAVADPIANANGYGGNNSASFSGTYGVKEAFFETVVPILQDSPLGQSLELNGAVRYADYIGAAGGQTTWKYGATYRPVEGLLLRAARSRDIRAPNIFERNVPPSGRGSTVRYGSASPNIFTLLQGNPDLQPEKADTTTIGFSYQPPFIPGLAFSVDHFRIDTRDLINTLTAQEVVDLCLLGGRADFCALISFDNPSTPDLPTGVLTPYVNLARVDLAGFDFQARYNLPLERLASGTPGAIEIKFAGTLTTDSKVNAGTFGAATIDRAGELGPRNNYAVARFRSTTTITYSDDRFSLSVQARQVSGGPYDVTYTPADLNILRVEGRTYFDLSTSFEVMDGVNVFALVNNVLDRDPPVAPTDNASPTNGAYFDTVGRVIKAGVRLRM